MIENRRSYFGEKQERVAGSEILRKINIRKKNSEVINGDLRAKLCTIIIPTSTSWQREEVQCNKISILLLTANMRRKSNSQPLMVDLHYVLTLY